jgi:glycosyltransferase involved in cell wall biosynthesis
MSLKVLLIGNYAADNQYSMQGFAKAMLSGLNAIGIEAQLIAPRQTAGKLGHPHRGIGKWLGYADKYLFFPADLRKALAWADVVHICDHGNAMYVPYLKSAPHVVTCHDLLAIRSALGDLQEWPTGRTGKVLQRWICRGIEQARLVACVSEATRSDLLRLLRKAPDRAAVIYNGLYSDYEPMPAAESSAIMERLMPGAAEPFVSHVGGNMPYKNRIGVLRIFDRLRQNPEWRSLRLVMAGQPFSGEMREFVSERSLEALVTEVVHPSNEELRAIYSRSLGLIFPSLYEGFGVPILEAQACGCPVFTSDRAPMTEVGGTAAVYFDPADPESAAQVIASRLAEARSLADEGFENCRRFTTAKMIQSYAELYQRAMQPGP